MMALGLGAAPPLVLASSSLTRQALLTNAGVPFDAIAPDIDEKAAKAALLAEGATPREVADALAELKAVKIGRRTGHLTLGSDQTLEIDGACIDKPETIEALKTQLLDLRGRAHKLHAAAVLVDAGAPVWREVRSATLYVRAFSDAFLDTYLEDVGPTVLGSVGGYHVEGFGLQLFDWVDGDQFTILGLPMTGLLGALRRRGVILP